MSDTTPTVSRLTGRPVHHLSTLAVKAAAPVTERVPDGLERIIRPQAAARWILPQLSAITPAYIESVMRGAFIGGHLQIWELFDLMEDTWPRLAKNLAEVKGAVAAMDWTLEPFAEEDTPPTPSSLEKVKLISDALWGMKPSPAADENGFDGTIKDILDAWGKGLSVQEVDWHIRNHPSLGDITAPRATLWVHPVNYAWSNEGRLGLRSEMAGGSTDAGTYSMLSPSYQPGRSVLTDFPEHKFLIGIHKAKSNHAMVSALLRPLAWWWCAANFSADWLMNLAQLFGLPIRWGMYPRGAAQATINAVADMLENMGSAAWAAFPEGTTLDLKTPGSLGQMSPQADLLDRADTNCDLIILGQTLTSKMDSSGGSFAAATVHEGVKLERVQAAANFAACVINEQLIPSILVLNYGEDSECPEFCPKPHKNEDVKLNAERDAILLAAGMEIPKDWYYKRHGVPLPSPGEEVIKQAAPTPVGKDGKPVKPGNPNDDPDPEDPEEDTEPVDEEDAPAKAKASERRAGVVRLVEAFADDLQPVRERLDRILSINDVSILRTKLEGFRDELPSLLKDINADPKSAMVIESLMRSAFIKGLKQ